MWAPDVVDFAVKKGLYPATAKKEDFSFSDIYDPPTFSGVRLGSSHALSSPARPALQTLFDNLIYGKIKFLVMFFGR